MGALGASPPEGPPREQLQDRKAEEYQQIPPVFLGVDDGATLGVDECDQPEEAREREPQAGPAGHVQRVKHVVADRAALERPASPLDDTADAERQEHRRHDDVESLHPPNAANAARTSSSLT